MPSVTPKPHAQVMASWPPAGASVPPVVTTCATTAVPNRMMIAVPTISAHSSPTSVFFMGLLGLGRGRRTVAATHARDAACDRQHTWFDHAERWVCYTCRVARRIQSIERAVAVLRVLGSAPHPLSLQEVSDS